MHVISVLNHKGGVGKSTIATNIAGYFANEGHNVLIGDFDTQQSSRNWLEIRPENTAPILTWEIKEGQLLSPPEETSHIIIDSPAGLRSSSLKKLVSLSDKIIVPLKPSIFDIMSAKSFLGEIIEMINEQEKSIDLCVIGNMIDSRTKSSEQLAKFVAEIELDSPTNIRQAQIYVNLAANGLTLFDSKNSILDKEKEQWYPLLDWLQA